MYSQGTLQTDGVRILVEGKEICPCEMYSGHDGVVLHCFSHAEDQKCTVHDVVVLRCGLSCGGSKVHWALWSYFALWFPMWRINLKRTFWRMSN